MTPGKAYSVALDWFTRGGAVFVASVGLAVVCGWLFDIPPLKSVMPGLATMKLNSACAFVAAGVALWLLHTSGQGSQSLRIGRALSVIVIAIGGLTLAEYVFALDLGIDQLILPDTARVAHGLPPRRMAPATALSFFMVGIALSTLTACNQRFASWPNWLVVPPLFISALAVVGYAYGVSSLYEVWAYSSMAAHTALAFFILTLSILAADLAHGFARIATSDTRRPGDMAARYGGEEFAMILPDTGLIGATQIAEAARDAIAQLKIPHERSPTAPYVSISGGISLLPQRTDSTAKQLISAADANLFQAKRLGRNQMVFAQTEPALKHA